MNVELISKTEGVGSYKDLNNSEIISAIARHGTIKEDGGKLVKYLMDHSHWSPLQHVSFGFKIETRRSISAQIFRHRSLNGQEWSLRYAEPLGFEDIELRMEHPTNRQSSTDEFDPSLTIKAGMYEGMGDSNYIDYEHNWGDPASLIIEAHMERTKYLYNKLIEAGVAKECARDILPLCTKTTIHLTGTLRDILGFLNIRNTPETQKECRDIANRIGEELEKHIPEIMSKINWRNGYFM